MTAFHALYEGRCDDCLEAIVIGELIERKPTGVYVHEVCPISPAELLPGEVVCETCWLVKPCGCDA